MATKEDLAEELNQKLDTNMEWERMKKDDLELFLEIVDEGLLLERLTKEYVKSKGAEKYEKKVDNWTPGEMVMRFL